MDCDGFVLSIRTQYINNYLKNFGDILDFSNLTENHELLSDKKQKNSWEM